METELTPGADVTAREGSKRLVAFLRAFNEKRNPTVCEVAQHRSYLWWRELPLCKWIEAAALADPADEASGSDDTDFLLRVTWPTELQPSPAPPACRYVRYACNHLGHGELPNLWGR